MVNYYLRFGKYKGLTIRDVMRTREGRLYLLWLADKKIVGKNEQRLIYTLIHQ